MNKQSRTETWQKALAHVLRSLWFLPLSYLCLLGILSPLITAISAVLDQPAGPVGAAIDPEFRVAIASSANGSDFQLIPLSALPQQLRDHPQTQLTIGRSSSQTADCEAQRIGESTASCSTYERVQESAEGDIIRVSETRAGKPDVISRYRVKGQSVVPLAASAPLEGVAGLLAGLGAVCLFVFGRIWHRQICRQES